MRVLENSSRRWVFGSNSSNSRWLGCTSSRMNASYCLISISQMLSWRRLQFTKLDNRRLKRDLQSSGLEAINGQWRSDTYHISNRSKLQCTLLNHFLNRWYYHCPTLYSPYETSNSWRSEIFFVANSSFNLLVPDNPTPTCLGLFNTSPFETSTLRRETLETALRVWVLIQLLIKSLKSNRFPLNQQAQLTMCSHGHSTDQDASGQLFAAKYCIYSQQKIGIFIYLKYINNITKKFFSR